MRRAMISRAKHLLRHTDETTGIIGAEVGYDRGEFFREFFEEGTGRTPVQYRREQRYWRARRYLRRTDLPVKLIAEKVGYATKAAFENSFKRASGLSCNSYRALESYDDQDCPFLIAPQFNR